MDFDRKDKKYWKLKMFYFNPEDKSVIVPKRTGIGVTFNFARPLPIVFTIILVAFLTSIIVAMIL